MAETSNPDPFLRLFDPHFISSMQPLLLVSGVYARAIRRPHPRLVDLLTELDEISGLALGDEFALTAIAAEPAQIARELFLRPIRVYSFVAMGMALRDSPLSDSPYVGTIGDPDSPTDPLTIAANMFFEWLESREQLQDLPVEYVPSAAFIRNLPRLPSATDSPAEESAGASENKLEAPDETDDAHMDDDDDNDDDELLAVAHCSGEELRWRRLRMNSTIQYAEDALRAVCVSDEMLTSSARSYIDVADSDSERYEYYHGPCLRLHIRPLNRAALGMALLMGQFWYTDSALPFAHMAGGLRWLRREKAVNELRERIGAITYNDEQDETEYQLLTFSLAELLTLYQALESLALAGLNDILPAVCQLRDQQQEYYRADKSLPHRAPDGVRTNPIAWIAESLGADDPFGQFFYISVSMFRELMEQRLTDERADDLAEARDQILALAELATSPDAV